MRKLIPIIFVLTTINLRAQNLVLNPSFETVNLPNLRCSWYTTGTQYINAVSNWDTPNKGTPDIYHTSLPVTCFNSPFSTEPASLGNQAPRTGNAMSNIMTLSSSGACPTGTYREYIQGELVSPLMVGISYDIKMYVSLADKMDRGTNNIGIKFSTSRQSTGDACVWNVTPDANYTATTIIDKMNWTLIELNYTPTVSGLRFFSIGNFFIDANTATTALAGSISGAVYYYIDDVSISVSPVTCDATITEAGPFCENDIAINLTSVDTGGIWTGMGITDTINGTFDPAIAMSGEHLITYTISGSCSDTGTTVITVNPSLEISLVTVNDNCEKSIGSIDLTLITGQPPITYIWDNGYITEDLDSLKKGIYTVTVTDSVDCSTTEAVNINNDTKLSCKCAIYIPNVFSPNGDGNNDLFIVRGQIPSETLFLIFDRWGNKVFETDNINDAWDGTKNSKMMNEGIYVYVLKGLDCNNDEFIYQGNITLLR